MAKRCPCYSGQLYAECCEPLHAGTPAPNAERLMRSRYSAYVLKLPEYLLHTWHPDSRPASLTLEDLNGFKWLKLQVLTYHQTDADHAEVAFIASFQQGQQKKSQLTEHSQFVRVDGRWLYRGETAHQER